MPFVKIYAFEINKWLSDMTRQNNIFINRLSKDKEKMSARFRAFEVSPGNEGDWDHFSQIDCLFLNFEVSPGNEGDWDPNIYSNCGFFILR